MIISGLQNGVRVEASLMILFASNLCTVFVMTLHFFMFEGHGHFTKSCNQLYHDLGTIGWNK